MTALQLSGRQVQQVVERQAVQFLIHLVNSKTKEKKFLQEPEINGERCFFVDDDKGGNWLAMFL